MAVRFAPPAQLLDKLGGIVPGGQLFFYEPGQTTILKDTFNADDSAIANANPVRLDAAGVQPNIFGSDDYRVVFKTAATASSPTGTQIWVFEVDFIGPTDLFVSYDPWDIAVTYSKGQRVTASDGFFYISLTNSNIANEPFTSPPEWSRLADTTIWNTNETYSIDSSAIASDGRFYTSQTNSNTGNDPLTDTVNWKLKALESVYDDQAFWMHSQQEISMSTVTAVKMSQTALTALTTTELYEVPANTTAILKEIVLCNTNTSTVNVTITAGDSTLVKNRILNAVDILPNETMTITLSTALVTTDIISGGASTGAIVSCTISGVEIT